MTVPAAVIGINGCSFNRYIKNRSAEIYRVKLYGTL
jgi:hypothetical protein